MSTRTTTADSRVRRIVDDLTPRRVALYAVLVGMIGFYLLPLMSGLMTSFKATIVGTQAPYLPPAPEQFTLLKWEEAFEVLRRGMLNSLILTIPATIVSATLGSIAAYGLTNVDWRGQVGLYALFLAGIFIPYQSVLVPLRRLWYTWIDMGDTVGVILAYFLGVSTRYGYLVALIITHIAYGIPICTLLFRSYYQELSDEMVEAARLDGATVPRIYRKIILPLSVPIFAVTLIFQFTQIWNELLFALIVVGPYDQAPVTVELAGLGVAQERVDYPLQMAGALLTALPTLLVYVVFGEQFAKGVAA